MEYSPPLSGKWMKISFNQDLDVLDIKNGNADFFFGVESDFLIHKNLLEIEKSIGKKNRDNIKHIAQKLTTALEEKRDVFLDFTQWHSGRIINTVAHIEYEAENHLTLYLTQIHEKDKTDNTANHAALAASSDDKYLNLKKEYDNLYNQSYTILESLPIGVELYSNDGNILYLNKKDGEIFGVDSEYIITHGGNVFNNPNLPKEVKEAILRKEKIRTQFPYNFDLASERNFFTSTLSNTIRQIECNGSPIANKDREIESYVFIIDDITEETIVKEELRQSKKKNRIGHAGLGCNAVGV